MTPLTYLEHYHGWQPTKGTTKARIRGYCPIHSEHTPSFDIYTDDWHYACHGCKANGDIIRLIQELEFGGGEPTREAYLRYQELTGSPLPAMKSATTTKRKSPGRQASPEQQAMLTDLASFWHECLWQPYAECQAARAYLQQRGVGMETRGRSAFPWLGYAPMQSTSRLASLGAFLLRRYGSSWRELASSLSILTWDGRMPMGGRIIFSCFRGETVHFYQGRAMPGLVEGPKYLNPSLAKVPFTIPVELPITIGTVVTESPFGPAVLHQYGIRAVATLGADTLPLDQLDMPIYCAQDHDEPHMQGRRWFQPGEEQASRLAKACREQGLEHERLLPPRQHKGIDEWVAHEGITPLLDAMTGQNAYGMVV